MRSMKVSMKTCKKCGKGIIWYQNHNGSWAPPLDDEPAFSGMVLVEENGSVTYGTGHEQHHCKPEDIRAEVQRDKTLEQMRHETLVFAWDDALPQECPKCKAEPGERCTHLASRKRKELVWPHVPRQTPAYQEHYRQHGLRPVNPEHLETGSTFHLNPE